MTGNSDNFLIRQRHSHVEHNLGSWLACGLRRGANGPDNALVSSTCSAARNKTTPPACDTARYPQVTQTRQGSTLIAIRQELRIFGRDTSRL